MNVALGQTVQIKTPTGILAGRIVGTEQLDPSRHIHQASIRATERAAEAKVTRCRCGACADRDLPPMEGCEACRRIAVERRRLSLRKESQQ